MVYRAQDTLLSRSVALKILYPELSADPLFVERFRREAQAAANLSHPNIVPVFDWGEDAGTYFIVMELVDGTSLAELLRGGSTLSPSRSAQIVAQVAAALGYAHRSGVVHRDIKPGNILITKDGQVKVTDFGIAQAVSSEDHLAEAGSVMGTATYFSPEQAEGAAVDGRSDVYSLGVVLYEMLVGRPPFVGDTPVEVSSQHVRGIVTPPSQISDAVPRELEAIVMEALAKNPDHRYQTADDLRSDLVRFSEGQPVQALQRDSAFFGADATRMVAAVPGDKTRSVPIMSGPRTDVRRRRHRNYAAPIAFVLALALVAGGAYAYIVHNDKPSISYMPGVVGQSVVSAEKLLKSDGFTIDTSYIASSKAKNNVVATDPKAGAHVVKGQTITLELSKGITTSPVTVMDYVGLNLAAAVSELQAAKLGYTTSYTQNATGNQVPGVVLAQSPMPGTKVRTGDTVTLTLLAQGAKYPVTSVVGKTQVAASAALTNQGLTVSSTTTALCSNTISQGLVIATDPVAGALVTSGTAIKLVISSGFCQVVVPNVVNDTENAATAALENVGLQPAYSLDVTVTCQPGEPPTVTTQSVSPGSSVAYGATVSLAVCQATQSGQSAPTTTST